MKNTFFVIIIIISCYVMSAAQDNSDKDKKVPITDTENNIKLIQQHMANYRYEEALKLAKELNQLFPGEKRVVDLKNENEKILAKIREKTFDQWIGEGRTAYLQKQYMTAVRYYSYALVLVPEEFNALDLRGRTYLAAKKYDKSIADYNFLLTKDPNNFEYLTLRGIVFLRSNKPQRAIQDFNKLIALRPDLYLGYTLRGEAYFVVREYKKAIADLTNAISIKKDYMEALMLRARSYHASEKYDKAILDWNVLIEKQPRSAYLYAMRCRSYIEKENYSSALADINMAIGIAPDSGQLSMLRAEVYEQSGEIDKVIAEYDNASKKLKGSYAQAVPINKLGMFYMSNKQLEKAVESFSKAIKIWPEYAEAYVNRAYAYIKMGEDQKASDDCKKVLTLDPRPADLNDVYIIQAVIEEGKDNLDNALELYEKAIENGENKIIVKYKRAVLQYRLGKIDKSQKSLVELEKLIQNSEMLEEIKIMLGNLEYKNKYYMNAQKKYRDALVLNKLSRATLHIAYTYLSMKNEKLYNLSMEKIQKEKPKDGYMVLYHAVGYFIEGPVVKGKSILRTLKDNKEFDPWTKALAQFILDEIDEEELRVIADEKAKIGEEGIECEINFYNAIRLMSKNKYDDANEALKKCLETKCYTYFEYFIADVVINGQKR